MNGTAIPFRRRLEALDVSLMSAISSQTRPGDRLSLLALQAACSERHRSFAHLEIGSHLGGSLQSFVLDERVTAIVSIDSRPESTPDARGREIPYAGNGTERMLAGLDALPGADVDKIHVIEADTRTLTPADVPVRPRLCFIDGEHTVDSCLADARFCRSVVASDGTIAFHDTGLVFAAIRRFLADLRGAGLEHVAYPLPDSIFVVELGRADLRGTAAMRRLLGEPASDLPVLARTLARRARQNTVVRRAALGLWLSELGAGDRLLARRRKRWRAVRTRRRKDVSDLLARRRKRVRKYLKVRRRRLAARARSLRRRGLVKRARTAGSRRRTPRPPSRP